MNSNLVDNLTAAFLVGIVCPPAGIVLAIVTLLPWILLITGSAWILTALYDRTRRSSS